MSAPLTDPAKALKDWLFDAALPLWLERGVDRDQGGYFEQLDFTGQALDVSFKRARLTGRQLYVFSQAAQFGVAQAAEAAQHGARFLLDHFWQGECGGWACTVRPDGSPLDGRADLYDQAFALFGLAWFGKLSDDPLVWQRAVDTIGFIEAKMSHQGGGFVPRLPFMGVIEQNPLMHLLEASLAAYDFSRDERFAQLALKLADVFEARLFDAKTGTLAEMFSADWVRLAQGQNILIEPGHQFEWVWILYELNRLLGRDLTAQAQSLARFAENYGVDRKQFTTFDAVDGAGAAVATTSRLWTNCERMKAASALGTATISSESPASLTWESSARALLSRHLDTVPRGLWLDRFDEHGGVASETVPASSLYHLTLAISEAVLKPRADVPHLP